MWYIIMFILGGIFGYLLCALMVISADDTFGEE